jgi:prepilin-type N-terminal cleavage/methylation domain-containing protein
MRRRGFTLIEMLAAITIGSVVLGIGIGILHVLLRAEETGRERVHQAQVLTHLAEQFRSDVGAAVRQMPAQDDRPKQWQFVLANDCTVTYRALPGEVRRDERTADKLVRQETYALPEGYTAAIRVERDAKPAIVSLVIAREPTPLAAGREMRVAAVLGKDHRFTKLSIGSQ